MKLGMGTLVPESRKDWYIINLPILNIKNVPMCLRSGLDEAANLVKDDLYKKLSNLKRRTGRRYVIGGKVHIASNADGSEYPAELTGLLKNSINSKVNGIDEFEVFSTSNERYIKELEDSQRHYLKRNIEENKNKIGKRIFDSIVRGIKGGKS